MYQTLLELYIFSHELELDPEDAPPSHPECPEAILVLNRDRPQPEQLGLVLLSAASSKHLNLAIWQCNMVMACNKQNFHILKVDAVH